MYRKSIIGITKQRGGNVNDNLMSRERGDEETDKVLFI